MTETIKFNRAAAEQISDAMLRRHYVRLSPEIGRLPIVSREIKEYCSSELAKHTRRSMGHFKIDDYAAAQKIAQREHPHLFFFAFSDVMKDSACDLIVEVGNDE